MSDPFDPSHANTADSDLGGTTPVHMYREGATVEGIWDLVGNVWEWSGDLDSADMAYLIGGSWYKDGRRSGASRSLSEAFMDWDTNVGFRVVVAPI